MWKAIFDIVTCNMFDKPLVFSETNMATWSNLYILNGMQKGPLTTSYSITDTVIRVNIMPGPTFIVRSNDNDMSSVHELCGQYVTADTRKTTDPVELRTLLRLSPNGDELFEDLIQFFPSSIKDRIDI
jgi:hypothetical protein